MNHLAIAGAKTWPKREDEPLVISWPIPGHLDRICSLTHPQDWIEMVESVILSPKVPDIISRKYRRAQRLYAYGWLEFDFIKAGEFVAITTLESALRDRYSRLQSIGGQPPALSRLLEYLVAKDGASDGSIPFAKKYGVSVIPSLLPRQRKRGAAASVDIGGYRLTEIRNKMAHGDPFDGLPWSGLLELIRDLIEYAYRDYIRPRK